LQLLNCGGVVARHRCDATEAGRQFNSGARSRDEQSVDTRGVSEE